MFHLHSEIQHDIFKKQFQEDVVLGQSIRAKMESDPEYKASAIAAIRNPEAMAKARAATIERWSDPEFRKKMSKAARNQLAEQRQDPEFNKLVSQAVSQMMKERWQTKEFRERMQGIVKGLWEDPDHRDLVSLSSQLLWLDLDRRTRMLNIPSVQGNRRDLDFYALSSWEANFGRVLDFLGSDYYTREIFTLNVTQEFSDLFNSSTTSMAIDFVTVDPEEQVKLYEIMAHPFEDPIGWAKLTMLMKQHPDLDITAITPDIYKELAQKYANQIEKSGDFCGWETTKDNLYSNPDKYK